MIRPIVKDILFLGQSEQGVRYLVQIIWKRYSASPPDNVYNTMNDGSLDKGV